jgi:urease gamma subunit
VDTVRPCFGVDAPMKVRQPSKKPQTPILGGAAMHLTVREEERIQIWSAAEMARRRLGRGLQLNYPEAVAVICDEILERAREGSIPMLTDMMEYGATILKRKDVMKGVPEMMKIIQVEALFPDGTKLVTVMNPIRN